MTDPGVATEWPESLPGQEEEERGIGVDAEEALNAFERAAAVVRHDEPSIVSLDDFTTAEPEPVGIGEEADAEDDARAEEEGEKEAALDVSAESKQPAPESVEVEEESAEASILQAEDLPQVITADMLRQRMAARRQGGSADADFGSVDDLEVPAELLESLEAAEESVDEISEEGGRHGKARRGSQTTGKKQPRRQRARRTRDFGDFEEEEFDA